MFYEILTIILPLVTSPYVSRILGSSGIGIYSYTYTVASYFVMFSALGIKNYGNREIARHREDQDDLNYTFSSLFYLHVIISGIVLAAYLIYAFFFAGDYKLYALIQSLYLIGALLDITWLFNGMEMFRVTVIRNAIIKILTVVAIFAFVNEPDDVWVYVFILALGSFLSQVYLWIYVFKYVTFCKVPFRAVKEHFPQLFMLFIPTVAISLYNYMDKIMVGAMAGDSQLGFYENSERIISGAFTVTVAIGTVMMPRMSNMVAKGNREQQKKSIHTTMQVVLCLSAAMAFGLIGVSNTFPVIYWGSEFAECSILISLLALILPVKGYANVIRTQYLIPNKMDKAYTVSVCVGAIVNVLVNFMLIPRLGALGAVIGTMLAEGAVCVVQACYSRRELSIVKYARESLPFFFFGAVMLLCVYGVGEFMGIHIITLIIQIMVGVIVYGLICLVYFKATDNRLFLDAFTEIVKKIKKKAR